MAKEFNLLGQSITITDEQDRYYQLCYFYRNLALSASESFSNFYTHSTTSLDSFLDKAPDYVLQLYTDACTNVLQSLVKYNLFEYNQDYLVDNYIIPYSHFNKAYDELDEFNANLISDKEAQNAYRTARRMSRGRWVGGGFGIGGAIKGAATAGAMNLATGAVHGIFNLAGSALTSLSVSSKKNKVYSDPETCHKLSQAVFRDIFNLRLAYVDIISERTDIEYAVITPEQITKSNILLKNIQQLNIPADKKPCLLVEALQLNPFSPDIYSYLFKNYPSEIDSIYEYVNYIKANYALQILKKDLSEFYATLPLDTEQDTLESKRKLEERIQLWRLSSSVELNDINARLAAFDLAARTFQGVEYKTREECSKAAADLAMLQSELESLDKLTPESLAKWNYFKEHVSSSSYADQVKSLIIPAIDKQYSVRLGEIKNSLKRSLSNEELSAFIAEINDMNIDDEAKKDPIKSVNYYISAKEREKKESYELSLFAKPFFDCNPCLTENKQRLYEVVAESCPTIACELNDLIAAFTPENIELVRNFNGPRSIKRPTFQGFNLIAALVSLFLAVFVFSGLLRLFFFFSFVYNICHIFSMEYHTPKHDRTLDELRSTMTYYGQLIHPMLRKESSQNTNNITS